MYEKARRGESIELSPRRISIFQFDVARSLEDRWLGICSLYMTLCLLCGFILNDISHKWSFYLNSQTHSRIHWIFAWSLVFMKAFLVFYSWQVLRKSVFLKILIYCVNLQTECGFSSDMLQRDIYPITLCRFWKGSGQVKHIWIQFSN